MSAHGLYRESGTTQGVWRSSNGYWKVIRCANDQWGVSLRDAYSPTARAIWPSLRGQRFPTLREAALALVTAEASVAPAPDALSQAFQAISDMNAPANEMAG